MASSFELDSRSANPTPLRPVNERVLTSARATQRGYGDHLHDGCRQDLGTRAAQLSNRVSRLGMCDTGRLSIRLYEIDTVYGREE
ncbi:unnamed protein product [Parajaminaea phylloscopi]